MSTKKINISESLGKLEDIVNWFKKQEEVDVEEGLKKLKTAVPMLKGLKGRLKEVEVEFEEIKQDLESEEVKESQEENIETKIEDIPF